MLGTAIIVFREVLEAALIIGIVLAASRGVAGRGLWVSVGVGVGLLGAGLIAGFAGSIAAAAEGYGQELFGATILLVAVVMLGWHNVWMGSHGRDLAREMGEVGTSVRAGDRPLYALAVVVCVAVLREGAEVVLFLYGIAAGADGGRAAMLAGGALGLGAGVGAGLALYLGLLNIPTRHLFTVTSWLVLLLAAGMASQAASFLVQAGLLPALGDQLWDSSAVLSQGSIAGRVLHTLIGYDDRPAGIQLLFYLATLAIIGGLMRTVGRTARTATAPLRTAELGGR
jgi:high-affinity iron transporter